MNAAPMARIALVALVIAAVGGVGYILKNVGIRLPLVSEDRFVVQVALRDAAGLDANDHPLATVAGTQQGRVVDVRRKGSVAIARIELDPGVRGRIFRDARAAVRPPGVVPVLAVDIEPGTPASGALRSGATISARRSRTYVAPDQVLQLLDTDTRAYLQVLVGEADVALRGRGGDLAAALRRLDPLATSARRVSDAVLDRRELVARLTTQLTELSQALAARRDDLARAIESGSRVLALTARRSPQLTATLRELPTTLDAVDRTLAQAQALEAPLHAAITATSPSLRRLPADLRRVETLLPKASKMVDDLATLERAADEQLPALLTFTGRLGPAARAGTPRVESAKRTVDTFSDYGPGIAQLGDLISGAVSTNNENGPLARAIFSSIEPIKPENLGFPPTATTTRAARTSRAESMLARVLDRSCRTEDLACVLRLATPGLPGSLVKEGK